MPIPTTIIVRHNGADLTYRADSFAAAKFIIDNLRIGKEELCFEVWQGAKLVYQHSFY
jgi:hypothetical protein